MNYEQKQKRYRVTIFEWDELFENSLNIFMYVFIGFFMAFLLWAELEYEIAEYIWGMFF